MPTDRVLTDFAGTWGIARDIVPSFGSPARFEGQAVWTPQEDTLTYVETGILSIPGSTPMRAERRYIWGADLSVYFEGGAFFHQVPAGGGRTVHFCEPDTYLVDYDFGDWPQFRTVWSVKGPKKSYVMTSLFTRQAAA
ncbi:MAG: DUF6314 family protein [Pseudomonadota bacterium]